MDEKIINRVAKSELITLDLSDYAPSKEIIELDLKQFLFDGIALKEKDFRQLLKEFNFNNYKHKAVAVFCSSDCVIPMWAYMLVTSLIRGVTSEIFFGEKNLVFQQLFLQNIENITASDFQNKKVIIKGCANIPLSEDLYIAITKKINPFVNSLMFGEACSAVPIYKKRKK